MNEIDLLRKEIEELRAQVKQLTAEPHRIKKTTRYYPACKEWDYYATKDR